MVEVVKMAASLFTPDGIALIYEDIGRNGIANTPQLAELSEMMEVVGIEAQR